MPTRRAELRPCGRPPRVPFGADPRAALRRLRPASAAGRSPFLQARGYALRLSIRGLKRLSFSVHQRPLSLPVGWASPWLVFVNSFEVMEQARWHRFQVLTKRSRRPRELAGRLPWPDHVWMGVSVETSAYLDRLEDLRATPARVKLLSLEPLSGPLEPLELSGIDWVIVGGESGPRARPMDPTCRCSARTITGCWRARTRARS